jgi:hypothetical protein
MSHADSHFVASRLVTVAVFAVCVRVTIRLISCKHESSVCFHVHAWLIATRKKKITDGNSIGDLFHLDQKVLIVRIDTALAAHQIARSTLPDLRQLVQTCILFLAPLTFTATVWTLEFQILFDLL